MKHQNILKFVTLDMPHVSSTVRRKLWWTRFMISLRDNRQEDSKDLTSYHANSLKLEFRLRSKKKQNKTKNTQTSGMSNRSSKYNY